MSVAVRARAGSLTRRYRPTGGGFQISETYG